MGIIMMVIMSIFANEMNPMVVDVLTPIVGMMTVVDVCTIALIVYFALEEWLLMTNKEEA